MVSYIQEIIKDIEHRFARFISGHVAERIAVLAEELDRLDPRDFAPSVQFSFTQARLTVRLWANQDDEVWTESFEAHKKAKSRIGSYEVALQELEDSPGNEEQKFTIRINLREEKLTESQERNRRTPYILELRKLVKILDSYGGENSSISIRKFAFIANADVRAIIERDYRELALSLLPSRSWKSAVVMAGSILEAILYDLLTVDQARITAAMGSPRAPRKTGNVVKVITNNTSADEWKLIDLINVCENLNLIPQTRTKTIDQVLRDYRNFVHPRKEIKAAHPCTEAEATLAKGALDGVCNHLE